MNAIAGAWRTSSSIILARLFEGAARPPHDADGPQLSFFAPLGSAAGSERTLLVGQIRIDERADLAASVGIAVELADRQSDAELLLRAWDRWGIDAFSRIEGDFAAALWDRTERRLILVRDALGQRPLFYRRFGDGIAFGSLPLPLAALSGSPRANLDTLAAFLADLPEIGEASYVAGVDRVLPGEAVVVDSSGALRRKLWWKPDMSPLRATPAEAIEAVGAELERAARGMVRTDAPVLGADLSGGLDSSLVVATASKVIGDRAKLLALTAAPAGQVDVPPNCFVDESGVAAETAQMLGVRRMSVPVASESPFAALDRWLPTAQGPFANACNLAWIDALYAEARNAGADAYLVGVRGNLAVSRPGVGRIEQLGRSGAFATLAREMIAYRKHSDVRWRGLFAMAFGHLLPTPLWNRLAPAHLRRGARDQEIAGMLLRPGSNHVRNAEAAAGDARPSLARETPQGRLVTVQMTDEGSTVHAVRVRYGLDIRDPLAARRVIELCLRLPPEHFFRDGQTRQLARGLLSGKAPDRVVNARIRGWQGANWRSAFESARPQMLAEIDAVRDDPELAALIDVVRARAMLEAWPTANWSDWDQIATYRSTLFRVVGAARFARFVREWAS